MVLLYLSLLAGRAGAVAPPAPPTVVTDPMLQTMISGLADEHPEGFGPAIEWLVAHPDLARPALLESDRRKRWMLEPESS